jgi:hypothetical protein
MPPPLTPSSTRSIRPGPRAVGGMASAWLYAFRADFMANSVVAAALLGLSGFMLWNITRIKTPVTADI